MAAQATNVFIQHPCKSSNLLAAQHIRRCITIQQSSTLLFNIRLHSSPTSPTADKQPLFARNIHNNYQYCT